MAGILSAISSINTEKARSTVKPRLTFSPDAAGSRKLQSVRKERMTQGMMTLKT